MFEQDEELIQWLKARKEPLIECINKNNEVYYLDIENHILYTLEEVKEWARQTQNTMAK